MLPFCLYDVSQGQGQGQGQGSLYIASYPGPTSPRYLGAGLTQFASASYRAVEFRRRLETLTLWLKVTVGLADRLCALSAWLGTPVTVPQVCNDNERPRSYSYERPPEPPVITVGSPKAKPGTPVSSWVS